MLRVRDLSGAPDWERRFHVDRVFLDPSAETVEDIIWAYTEHERLTLETRYYFFKAPVLLSVVNEYEYPVYIIAIGVDGLMQTASTPMLAERRRDMTKALRRFAKSAWGHKRFRGSFGFFDNIDGTPQRIAWAKFLGFDKTSAIWAPRAVFAAFAKFPEIEAHSLKWPWRLFYRLKASKMVFKGV